MIKIRVFAFIISVLAVMNLPVSAMADCGAVPIGHADDMAISFLRVNGTQIAPASQLNSAVKRGVVVYDTTDDSLKLCNGTDWVSVGTGEGAGGSTTLAALTDVDVAGATNGQALVYDAMLSQWVAKDIAGGGASVMFSARGFADKADNKLSKFQSVDSNIGSGFDNNTGVFTATKAGVYYFRTSVLSQGTGTVQLALLKNGNLFSKAYGHNNFQQVTTAAPVWLEVGDTVVTNLSLGSGAQLHTNFWDSFSGVIIDGGGGTGGEGGSTTLAALTDVDVAGATNGQALVFNSVSHKWEAQSFAGAGFSLGSPIAVNVPGNSIFSGQCKLQAAQSLVVPKTGYYYVESALRGYVYSGEVVHVTMDLLDSADVPVIRSVTGSARTGAHYVAIDNSKIVYLDAGTYSMQVIGDNGSGNCASFSWNRLISAGFTVREILGGGGSGGGGGGETAAAGGAGQIQFNDGTNKFAANSDLSWDNASKRLGVGKAVPAYALDVARAMSNNVNGDGAENSYRIARFSASSGSDRGLEIGAPTGGITSPVYLKVYGTSNDLVFYNENDDRLLTIKADGNVGIGTDTPRSKLHVSGPAADIALSASDTNLVALLSSHSREGSRGALYFNHDSTPIYNDIYLGSAFELVDAGSVAAPTFKHAGSHSTNAHILSIGHTGVKFLRGGEGTIGTSFTPVTSMFIAPSGNVGIGTNDPKGRLSLPNFSTAGGPQGNYSNYQIMLYSSPTANASYGMGMESSNIWMNTAGGVKFYVAGGHVSTIAPNGVYSVVSDSRLKDDIKPLEGALDKISTLRGVSFVWKDRETKGAGLEVGLIAQDVQAVYPELVVTDLNGTLSVNYAGLVAPLIEAVKTLKDENEALRAEILSLRGDMDMLKAIVLGDVDDKENP